MRYEKRYKNTKPVAVFIENNWGGVEILDIVHGIDDHVVSAFNFGDGRKSIAKSKIRYEIDKTGENNDRPYFMRYGNRYYLEYFMKV